MLEDMRTIGFLREASTCEFIAEEAPEWPGSARFYSQKYWSSQGQAASPGPYPGRAWSTQTGQPAVPALWLFLPALWGPVMDGVRPSFSSSKLFCCQSPHWLCWYPPFAVHVLEAKLTLSKWMCLWYTFKLRFLLFFFFHFWRQGFTL